VLGAEIATDAVLAAWGAAYQQLADLLMGAEAAIYDEKAAAPGGWRGARAFRVARKVVESDEITSFYLAAADGGALLAYRAGQYIGVRLVVDGVEVRRNYSLSQQYSEQTSGAHYRISVKREPGGVASCYLHDQVQEGSTLELFVPSGQFTLGDSGSSGTSGNGGNNGNGGKPVVLISGGVGITPTLAMLQEALASGRDVVFIHAARHGGVHAFRAEIDALAARHRQLTVHYVYGQQQPGDGAVAAYGLLTPELLAAWLPAQRDLDAYVLGPLGFMRFVRQTLRALGVPVAQTHHEFFGPASALE
jgi:nitric oxide dioxygenase